MPITSPVDFISGPRMVSTEVPSTVRNRLNGITASLTAIGPVWLSVAPSPTGRSRPSARRPAMLAPSITRAAALASGVAVALETNGTVRDARGLASSTNRVSPASANWMLIRPRTPTPSAMASGGLADPVDHLGPEGDGRQRAGRVAGVDAGLLDVLHHATEIELAAVVERVDVDLHGVVEELVDQHRVLRGDLGGPVDVGGQGGLVVDDLHPAAAEHVRGPHQHRVADHLGDPLRLGEGAGHPVLRGGQAGLGQHLPERASLLGQVDGLRAGADHRYAGVLERLGQPQRGLPAELRRPPRRSVPAAASAW